MTLRIKSIGVVMLFFSLIFTLPLFMYAEKDCNWYITIISMIQLILCLYALKKHAFPLFSLPSLFLILSTVFHFGEAWLLAFNRYDLFNYTNIDLAMSMATYNYANAFALMVQGFVAFGIMCCGRKIDYKKKKNNENDENYKIKAAFKIGVILTAIGFVPQFLYYYSMVKIILSGGVYAGIRSTVDLGPIVLLAGFYQPGAYLLLLGCKNNKRKATIVLVVEVAFELFCMISGNRSMQIIMILMYLFIYYRAIGARFSFKKGVLFAIAGYLMLIVLYFISAYRNFEIANKATLIQRFTDVATGEPMLELLAQLGSNLNVVVLSLVSIPSYHPFNMGLTYIVSWLSVYPNTGGLLGNIPQMYVFLNYLDTNLPLGGSYIGELYFNFGWLSMPFAICIGLFLGRVSNRIESLIYEKEWIKLVIYMVMFSQLIWWVRDYFSAWIFRTVWAWLGIYLVKSVFKIKENRGRS